MTTHRNSKLHNVDIFEEDYQFFEEIRKDQNLPSIASTINEFIELYGSHLEKEKSIKKGHGPVKK